MIDNIEKWNGSADVEKKAKDLKGKAKGYIDQILDKHRVDKGEIETKDGKAKDKSGTFIVRDNGKTYKITWVHSFTPGGKPTVTSARMNDYPKITEVGK